MKKKTIYGALALSSLLLGSVATGFADDNIQSDNPTDAVVITPIDVPINPPVEPTPEPVEPPVTDVVDEQIEPDVGPTDPVIVSPIDTPVLDEDKTEEKEPEALVDPNQEEQADRDKKDEDSQKDSQPSETPIVVEAPPITLPTYEEPVVTETGYQVVSTENSQVVILTEEGQVEVVAPETVGAKQQEDGTLVVKSSDGQMKVLPATGEHDAMVLTVFGVISVLAALFMAFCDKVKVFFDKQDEG